MPTVKFGFDVGHHLDSVDHQVAHQPIDDGIPHHHPDQTGISQVTFPELSTGQILVLEHRHTGQYPPAYRHPPAMPHATAGADTRNWSPRLKTERGTGIRHAGDHVFTGFGAIVPILAAAGLVPGPCVSPSRSG